MRNKTKKLIGIFIVITILIFFIKAFIKNWSQIQNFEFNFNIPLYIFSTLILIAVVFLWGILWNFILRDLGFKELSFYESFKIEIYAWFGKYLPGKIGLIGTKLYMGNNQGINMSTLLISTIYENIFQIFTSLLISIPILFFYFLKELNSNPLIYKILPLSFIVGLFIFIHPKVFFYTVNFCLKKIKKAPIPKEYFLTVKQIVMYFLFYSIGAILNGIAFFLFIRAITFFPSENIIMTIGILNFAGTIGLLAIFVPAGLGVREGVIVLFLKSCIPIEMAILISILSRAWITIADGLLGFYILILKFKNRNIQTLKFMSKR